MKSYPRARRNAAKRLSVFAAMAALLCAHKVLADAAYAWGADDSGQLGNGTYDPSSPFGNQSSPAPVIGLSSGITVASAGAESSLAVQSGAVYSWGSDAFGQLGNASDYTYPYHSLIPVATTSLTSGVSAVAAGGYHSLALQNGGVYAWGDNSAGELGNGTFNSSLTPVAVSGLATGVTAIAAGKYYSLAIRNGGAYAWGGNWHGQLGDGTTSNSSAPVPVTGLSSGVTTIAAGGSSEGNTGGVLNGTYSSYCLAVKQGGVYAWGANSNGELGTGTTTSTLTPVSVTGLSGGVTAIAAGALTSLAVQNGNVYAWGYNYYGQLGDGTTTTELTPVEIDPASLSNITSVAESDFSSYALAANGSLWVWGYNAYGELGLGTNVYTGNLDYLTPQQLLPPAGYQFTSISANGDGLFALATLAPVPEPTSLWPLAIGSTALLSRRSRTWKGNGAVCAGKSR